MQRSALALDGFSATLFDLFAHREKTDERQ
jgi:hypothetical protein